MGKLDRLEASAVLVSSYVSAGDLIVCLFTAGINISAGMVFKTGLIIGTLLALGMMLTSTSG